MVFKQNSALNYVKRLVPSSKQLKQNQKFKKKYPTIFSVKCVQMISDTANTYAKLCSIVKTIYGLMTQNVL